MQVQTALDSESAAASLATTLVEERLAACVQVVGPITSTYRWKGEIEQAMEWLCVAKTAKSLTSVVISRIRDLHPYQEPEILVTAATDGSAGYLDWVLSETRQPGNQP